MDSVSDWSKSLTTLATLQAPQPRIYEMWSLSRVDLCFSHVNVLQPRFPCSYVPIRNTQQLEIRLWSSDVEWKCVRTKPVNKTGQKWFIIHDFCFTLISAHHHPHASLSFDRENTSTSMPSTNAGGAAVSSGGKRTWLNRNLDSFCQLKIVLKLLTDYV